MIYQTIALNYVRLVNPYVYKQAIKYNAEAKNWCQNATPRASEMQFGNWTLAKDGKLTGSLEDFSDAMERRTARLMARN